MVALIHDAIIEKPRKFPEYSENRGSHHVGEWLSLVEHLVRDQGVGGSNPLSPTKKSALTSLFSGLSSQWLPTGGYSGINPHPTLPKSTN
jgi:hypothetical protein